ncbi:unnamed protein product [Lupinus luteus]|uniref:Transmembrane protein n=1 Tax=Lupinus luteus TaxID=3873 RepID=A0AAV1XVQ8_LUPLU
MVGAHYKRMLLVLFFILCFFISMQAKVRAPKETHNKEVFDVKFKPREDGEGNDQGQVFSMDYTPARRKPPIHN